MNPEGMQPDMPPEAAEHINRVDAGSNMDVLGAKLWWMITARRVLRFWPGREAMDRQLALRKAEMHENLRIHVARRRLGNGQDSGQDSGQ